MDQQITKIWDAEDETGTRNEIFQVEDARLGVRHVSRMSISPATAAVIRTEAQYLSECGRMNGKNHKHMGVMPISAFLGLQKQARAEGRALDSRDFKKYFLENGGFAIKKI